MDILIKNIRYYDYARYDLFKNLQRELNLLTGNFDLQLPRGRTFAIMRLKRIEDTEMVFKYLANRPLYFNKQRLYFEVTLRRHPSIHWLNPLDEPIVEHGEPNPLVPQTSTDDKVPVERPTPVAEETLISFAEPSLNIKPADRETLQTQRMNEQIRLALAEAEMKYKASLPTAKRRNTLHLKDATCPVCLAGFEEIEIDNFYILPCSHGICGNCLKKVSFRRVFGNELTDCPVCRSQSDTKAAMQLKL